MARCVTCAALTAALAFSGCSLGPRLRAGAAVSGVISASSTVDTDNPILVDAFVRVDVSMLQVEASYGQQSYTYDYRDQAAVDQTGDMTVQPLAFTARLGLGRFWGGGVRRLWLIGAGVVYNHVDGGEVEYDDNPGIDMYRFILGHEWDWGKAYVSAEAIYETAQDFSSDDPTVMDVVEINMSGYLTRIAVGVRF